MSDTNHSDVVVVMCDAHGPLYTRELVNGACIYCTLEAGRRADDQRKRDADRGK